MDKTHDCQKDPVVELLPANVICPSTNPRSNSEAEKLTRGTHLNDLLKGQFYSAPF